MPGTTDALIGEPDTALLLALNRFNYLTAAQASRLLYPNLRDDNRYAQRRLKRLVDSGFVLRLGNQPVLSTGSFPYVFTLARPGRVYLNRLGIETPSYFRRSEEKEKAVNRLFMQHTLCVIDVLLAADRLSKEQNVTCLRLISERELKRNPQRVQVPPAPGADGERMLSVTVIPDGWFQLEVDGNVSSIALELDRGTEEQKFWRRKIAALIAWVDGPYPEAFETDNVTIAVVTPSDARRDKLREWTAGEIAHRGLSSEYEELFLFTSADPVTMSPGSFFFDPVWYLPRSELPISLLDRPVNEQGLVD